MMDLIRELEEVTEWDYLGTCLGLPEPTLQTIRRDHRNTENRRREVLMVWAKIKVPTWRRVVRALLEMGRDVLAKRIAGKYGKYSPQDFTDISLYADVKASLLYIYIYTDIKPPSYCMLIKI